MAARPTALLAAFALALVSLGCSSSLSGSLPTSEEGDWAGKGSYADAGSGYYPGGPTGSPGADSGTAGYSDAGGGSFGSVGTGGAGDFAFFRKALADGKIPAVDSIDAAGFFAEHYTSLPAPTCGKTFCLHGMFSVSPDYVRGGDWTLLQMAMNSPIDPTKIEKPPLELAVVLDRSGSMMGNKMEYAKQGVQLLVDALGPADRLTLIAFDDAIETVFGPATVTDKTALKTKIAAITPRGSTNLYGSLEAGYKAISTASEQLQRRVIFLTDGVATAGITSPDAIKTMSAGWNAKHLGLTTIGLGSDVSIGLLRGLAEQGAGNFYYIEKVEAVKEVFTEELAYFVAPLAYDLELTYTEMPAYSTKIVHGTNLWTGFPGGGKIAIPSVFLVSRTSTAPGPDGGRRGGGSAIIAELLATGKVPLSLHDVAKLNLKYRTPGSTVFETQEVLVKHDGQPGVAPEGGSFDNKSVEKNTIILGFFVAFRDATKLAQTDKLAARTLLEGFQTKITARLAGFTDEDLLDDLKILQRYIDVLKL
ncbi:MAG: VWA domain-containing protein [Deltaproteobacteria bacterium]|nr:VWA domain-containing protein [Deltaproteobacteria bacterium]